MSNRSGYIVLLVVFMLTCLVISSFYLMYRIYELKEMQIENYECKSDGGIYYLETRECYRILDILDKHGFYQQEKLW